MKNRGFSLTEVLIVVAVIGVVATVANVAYTDISSSVQSQKMASDLDSLNRAVKIYLANGGNLSDAESIDDVVTRLKSAVADEDRDQSIGLTSSMVDSRLTTRVVKRSKGADSLSWNATTQSFQLTPSQDGSVTEVVLDDDLAESDRATDNREFAMSFAEESNWIWDYKDQMPANTNLGSTPVTVVSTPPESGPAPSTSTSGGGGSPPPAPTVPSGTLSPPKTSIPGGTYPIYNYDLDVTLTDPNTPGTAKLVYALDYGSWIDYSGTIIVPAGSTLSVQALALSEDWSDSRKDDYGYEASAATLAPPIITPSRDQFSFWGNGNINVTLQNPNPAGSSTMTYRLNGGPWLAYSDKFKLSRGDYPNGVRIEAKAESASSPYWSPSSTSSRTLTTTTLDLSGSSSGLFSNPVGDAGGLVSNLAGSGVTESSYFDWGDANARAGDTRNFARSSMDFTGLNFGAVNEGERFEVGSLTYFNGTTYTYTDATETVRTAARSVSFAFNVGMEASGVSFGTTFNFDFELINTKNAEDPNNPWPDADYVRINSPVASETLLIDGREFEFRLEFGEATETGFTQFDEFHILEWKSATSKLYGTFTEVMAQP